jgi:hypothetical protein
VSAILKAKILDRYSWETNPLKRVLNFLSTFKSLSHILNL